MSRVLVCRTCGRPDVVTVGECPICRATDSYVEVPFTSGYDEPHRLNMWVRASSLERVAGEPNLPNALRVALSEADVDEAEDLRDIAAMLEQRLNELDVEAIARGDAL